MLSKKVKKLALVGVMIAGLWSAQSVATEAASGVQLKTKKIYVNEQAVTTTVIEQNGYQLVPASLFRQLGATVEWSSAENLPVVSKGALQVKLPIGKRTAYYTSSNNKTWKTDANLDTRTALIGGKSYVPLAYTAKKLGIQVEYDTKLQAARLLVSLAGQQANKGQQDGQAAGSMSANSITSSSKVLLSDEDLYWLYQLTEAEAGGESYKGRVAVAATVLNRVESDEWPDTAVETIFEIAYVNGKAYYQFEPVLNDWIYKVSPSEDTKKAVQAAINGEDPTDGAVVFYNPRKTSNAWILSRPVTVTIGNHVFAR